MRSRIWDLLTKEHPEPSAAYRYGVLLLAAGFLTWAAWWTLQSPLPAGEWQRYQSFPLPLTLLFLHLAFSFRWPQPARVVLRAFSIIWLILVFWSIRLLA